MTAGSSGGAESSRLSPVTQEESLSPLAFANTRRAATPPPGPPPVPAAAPRAAAAPAGGGRVGSGLMNMVGRIGSGAASASEAIFGRTPSASSLSNQAGGPPSGSSAAAAAGGVAAPLDRRSPSPGPPGSAGAGARLSLAWVQEQFARGVAVTGSARGGTQPAAGARAALPSPLPPPAQQQQQQQQQQPASPFGSEAWPLGLPERLLLKRSLRLQAEPLSAVALTASPGSLGAHAGGGAPADGPGAAGGLACCVGHGGLLRVLGAPALGTLRSAKLQEDLLSLCLLPAAAAEKPHLASAAGPVGAPLLTQHHVHDVIMLAGSSNRRVLAFSPPAGRLLGSWAAHEDAVSCVARLGRGGGGGDTASGAGVRLVTASWDCSVKVWDVAEGRQPWDSSLPLAAAELRDFESGVWAVAGSGSGQLVVAGTEEGAVSAWDLRSRRQAWSTKVGAPGSESGREARFFWGVGAVRRPGWGLTGRRRAGCGWWCLQGQRLSKGPGGPQF
jgi:hypothetical protein